MDATRQPGRRAIYRAIAGVALAFALTAMGVGISPGAAHAAVSEVKCDVYLLSCTTASLKPGPEHYVRVRVFAGTNAACHWRVRDVGNGVVVGSGWAAPRLEDYEKISGLYGTYQLELYSCRFPAYGVMRGY